MLVYYYLCAFTVATLAMYRGMFMYLFYLLGKTFAWFFLLAGSSMAAQLGAGELVGANAEGQLSQREKMPLFSLCFCFSMALADDSFQSTFLSVAAPVILLFHISYFFLSSCPHRRNLFYSDTPFSITELEEVLGMFLGWCGRNCCGCGTI